MDFDEKFATYMRRDDSAMICYNINIEYLTVATLPLHCRGRKFESSIAHSH